MNSEVVRGLYSMKMPELKALYYDQWRLAKKSSDYVKKQDLLALLLNHVREQEAKGIAVSLVHQQGPPFPLPPPPPPSLLSTNGLPSFARRLHPPPPFPPPLSNSAPRFAGFQLSSVMKGPHQSASLAKPSCTLSVPQWARASVNGPGSQPSTSQAAAASSQQRTPETDTLPPPPGSAIRCLCGPGTGLSLGPLLQCDACRVYQHQGCVAQEIASQGGKSCRAYERWNSGFGFLCERCRADRCDPFYETVAPGGDLIPLALMRKTSKSILVGATNQPQIFIERTFNLSQSLMDLLSRQVRDGIDRQYRIQVYCLCLNDSTPNRYHWPAGLEMKIRVNQLAPMSLRPYARQGHVKLGLNGRDEAMDITSFCLGMTARDQRATSPITLSCSGGDSKTFVLGVSLVARRSFEGVKRLMHPPLMLDAMKRIKSHLASSDDIVINASKLSLKDPMTGARIKTAARYVNSSSILCFDLDTCLEIAARTKKWQCPHSAQDSHISLLALDGFMQEIIDSLGSSDLTEIEVNPEGQWRPASSQCPFIFPGQPFISQGPDSGAKEEDEDEDEMENVRRAARAFANRQVEPNALANGVGPPSDRKRKREDIDVIVID